MAAIPRKTAKIFAGTAGGTGVAVPGSVADGSVVYSTDLAVLQSTAFVNGLADMIIAGTKRLEVYEEANAVDYVLSTQIAYLLERGIPEWDTGTEYNITDIVRKTGTYELYGSVGNANQGNALPSAVTDANWTYLGTLANLSGGITALTGDVTASGTGSVTATIATNAVTLSKLATQAANTVLVNGTSGVAVPTALAMANSTVLARSASGNVVGHTLSGLTATSGVLAIAGGNSLQTPLVNTTATYTTLTGNIPYDNTIPQSSEGTQIFSQAITPTSATSKIIIEGVINFGVASSGTNFSLTLLQDAIANALYSACFYGQSNSHQYVMPFRFEVVSGSTSARTYKLNGGCDSGNSHLNGDQASRIQGGVQLCNMTIREELQ
jgi:hypothetical protein